MQVFVPYPSPISVALCLDQRRLNKQIIECGQILDAIEGRKKAWSNHPITKMYTPHRRWLKYYCKCLNLYRLGYMEDALVHSEIANKFKPSFITEEFCIQHRKRLYTKNPEHYKIFADYGKSEENWYFVDGVLRKYINGKRI